jgi:LytS/YehU family sensor histidine kinase
MLLITNLYLGAIMLGWPATAYRSLLNVWCHLLNFYAFYSWIMPYYFEKRKYFHTLLASLAVLIILTPFRFKIEQTFLTSGPLIRQFGNIGRVTFILFTETAIGGFASLIRLAADRARTRQRVTVLEKLNLESELRFLKAQMNPHFLFNTINNIYSLTLIKSDKAPEALMRLSGLLRYLLYETQTRVTLEREVQALAAYAELFQLKYENPVRLTVEVAADRTLPIEPLILIPILENMEKHAGLGILEHAYATLRIYEEGTFLVIRGENSVTDLPAMSESGGIGLANIKKRLQVAYPEKHTLLIHQSPDHFSLTLKISMV